MQPLRRNLQSEWGEAVRGGGRLGLTAGWGSRALVLGGWKIQWAEFSVQWCQHTFTKAMEHCIRANVAAKNADTSEKLRSISEARPLAETEEQ